MRTPWGRLSAGLSTRHSATHGRSGPGGGGGPGGCGGGGPGGDS